MHIKALEVGYLQTNCYFVTDEATLDTAVIDPGADSNAILEYIEQHKLQVKAILLTHGHFDHCMGLEEVYEATKAPVYMSHKDLGQQISSDFFGSDWELDPPDDTVFVSEGDEIEAGALRFTVLETPGHTPGGLTFMIEDCLFTGDTLFRLSCGRYDFPGSSALELGHSLEKLRDLEGDYEVFPGHESFTTLDFERRFNPYMLNPWAL
ncbi:MAG: MBL fold metallo-hydrolase [Oscillospiraceae bacterium]|nr:MBL fold metallo-hydrolase [Oscillospiraceae bacterium]